jgi:lambda family phage tail tape measure protein
MANMIARLGVVLGLDTAEFNKGIESAGKKLEQFSQTAEKFGKMGATALVAATAAALQYADELSDVAQANEIAIGTVLKLSDALANNGGKADNAGKMLSAFSKFIDEAASGSDQAQKTAAKLGVTLKDLGTLSQEQLLNKFVKNLAAVEDPITRSAKSMEVFSKAAKSVDMVGFAEQMAEANKVTKEQEEAIKQAAEMFDVMGQNARKTMLVIATEVGPTLKAFSDFLKDLNGETNDFGNAFKVVFQTVAVVAANVLYVVKSIFGEIYAIGSYIDNLINKNWATAEAENDAYIKKTIKERAALDDFYDRVMNPASPAKQSTAAPNVGRKISESKEAEAARKKQMQIYAQGAAHALKAAEEDAKARAEFFSSYEKGNAAVAERQRLMNIALDNEKEMMLLEMKSANMRQEDYTLERERLQIKQQLAANLEEIDNRRDLTAEARAQAEAREVALSEKALAIAQERYQLTLQSRQGTFEEGFTKNAMRFLRDMPTELEQGAKAFDSLMGNMESAIDRFVKTGKIGFKDLARSIIQDMLAMQMKAAASGFLSSLFGSMFGMKSNPYQPAAVMGMPGYADGGNPAVNSPSIVGERGPELFVPRTAGTIIPNHALAGVGGTTNVTNNYINAIDTKSFEQRLLGSPNAVWAANQYATKSLAVSRGRT